MGISTKVVHSSLSPSWQELHVLQAQQQGVEHDETKVEKLQDAARMIMDADQLIRAGDSLAPRAKLRSATAAGSQAAGGFLKIRVLEEHARGSQNTLQNNNLVRK